MPWNWAGNSCCFSDLQLFMMHFSILNVSLPHCHLSEVLLSFMKRSFMGPSQPEEPATYIWLVQASLSFPQLISFSTGLWLVKYVNIFLQELQEKRIPPLETLSQYQIENYLSRLDIPQLICLFLAYLICAVWILYHEEVEVFCHMLLKIYYLINQMCNPVREWDQFCVIQPIF